MADGQTYAGSGTNDKDTAIRICKRRDALFGLRGPHEQVWKDCFDFTHPLRGDGFNQEIYTATEGQNKQARLLDSTGTDASRLLASSIMSGLTPANGLWFDLNVNDESQEEKAFFSNAAETVWGNIHQANFDSEAYECCLDIVEAGWFVLYVDADRNEGGLTFEQWHIANCAIASSRRDGVIDTIYRDFRLSASAVVNTFGEDGVSADLKKLAKEKPDDMVDLIQCIEPRNGKPGQMAKNLPFASYTLEKKSKHLLKESGYHEFPCCVPRWMRIPKSCYGVGPVFDALPDIRMLNELKAMELASADIAISGMWIATDDGVLNPRTIKLGPKKVVIANTVDSMKPLVTGANFQLSEMMVDRLTANIRRTLMADQLQPQNGPQMTATEVHVRVEMIRQLLGPVYGRLQAEYLQPLVERCFGLCYRAGILGQAPPSLAGKSYSVKYVSPLARAQRLDEVQSIEAFYQDIGLVAQGTGDASVADIIDSELALRRIGEGRGVPASIMRSSDDIAAIRQQRAQAQQAQQQQAQIAQSQQAMTDGLAKGAAAQATNA